VVLYIVIPVLLAQLWRKLLLARGNQALERALQHLHPFSLLALLFTLVLLFAFQGKAIVAHPLIIAMLAVPITIQVVLYLRPGLLANRRMAKHIAWPDISADRRVEFFRAGRGRSHQPVWF